jgi:hypothetical protein
MTAMMYQTLTVETMLLQFITNQLQGMTIMNIKEIIEQAKAVANQEATKFLKENLNGEDKYACGFAWVSIYGIRANSKVGKELQALGITKHYGEKAHTLWNPSDLSVQNIDTKEAGAMACAKFLEQHGFRAFACSRLD